jgi:hypothetical protein
VSKSDKPTVSEFLNKWSLACSNSVFIVPRDKNRDSLSQLGWTMDMAKTELKKLSLSNYVKGPEEDRDNPGEFWFFGRPSNQGDVYIKVKIFEHKGKLNAKCVSFHLAEYPLKYPYK